MVSDQKMHAEKDPIHSFNQPIFVLGFVFDDP